MKNSILVICLILSLSVSSDAQTLTEEVRKLQSLRLEQRIQRLQKLSRQPQYKAEEAAIQCLITDARYERLKSEQASEIFKIARTRVAEAPSVTESPFIRYSSLTDGLAIAQGLLIEWLPHAEREEFLQWNMDTYREINEIQPILNLAQSHNAVTSEHSDPGDNEEVNEDKDFLEEVRGDINAILREAQAEDISLLRNVAPNGFLSNCLQRCRVALNKLLQKESQLIYAAEAELDETLSYVHNTMALLEKRQHVKYALWAEKQYRTSLHSNADTPVTLYRRLGLIDLDLILEPSVAREVATRMSELYEEVRSTEEKTKLRYESIMQLDKRKALSDF